MGGAADVKEDAPRKKPSLRGIKKQARYEPGVPMTKEELTGWRKEARRVRNRESAAASRRKTKERIGVLESEVAALESKYKVALQRIIDLEAAALRHKFSVTPDILRQDLVDIVQTSTPPQSPKIQPRNTISPSPSHLEVNISHHQEEVAKKYQHIMDMISRPTAAKITGADTSSSTFPSCDPCPVPFISATPNPSDVSEFSASTAEASNDGGGTLSEVNDDGGGGGDGHGLSQLDDLDMGNFLLETFDDLDPTNEELAGLIA